MLILLFIVDYFDLWIRILDILDYFFDLWICNQDVSVQEDGKSIPLQEIADNHNNRGNEAQDKEDSSNE